MPKPIALFDLDNTLYRGFSLFPLMKQQVAEGLIPAGTLDQAVALLGQYRAGVMTYEDAVRHVLDTNAAGVKGVPYDAALESAERFFQDSDGFFDYAAPVIKVFASTHKIVLITAEPQVIAEAAIKALGIDAYDATEYEIKNGHFTGEVTSHLASRHDKHAVVKRIMGENAGTGSFAFGDSAGDIEMLAAVQYPICINADAELREAAEHNGWRVVTAEGIVSVVAGLQI